MTKRSKSSLPPEHPSPKRILKDRYQVTVEEMHEMIARIVPDSDEEPDDTLLAIVLSIITRKAPSEARIKKEVALEAEELIKIPELKAALNRAIHVGNYEEILSMSILKTDDIDSASSDGPEHTGEVHLVNRRNAAFNASLAPYLGNFPRALVKTIDAYSKDRRFSKSIAIVQSSGTGKSRGVVEASKIRFAFLFNLGRRPSDGQYRYPLPDDKVRKYLTSRRMTREERFDRYVAFFCSLFDKAGELISNMNRKGVPLPKWWHDFVNAGESENHPGIQRVKFYREVIEGAHRKLHQPSNLITSLKNSCNDFVLRLIKQYLLDGEEPHILCLLVFDEVQELRFTRHGESYYDTLRSVLRVINPSRVFAVFLSTTSSLGMLVSRGHPSNKKLRPPFTELPFDISAQCLNDELRQNGESTLKKICGIDVMLRFGRTLWQSLSKDPDSILPFAMAKLNPKHNFVADNLAQFACLAIRVGLDFDASREKIAAETEVKLVNTYMRVVFAIPAHCEYMRTGTPSEPILAEAAARLLNGVEGVTLGELAPKILSDAFQRGFLARGERGEMVARVLWIMAHDQAAREYAGTDDPIIFHRPIPVMKFLKCLFPKKYWAAISKAKPIGDKKGLPLHKAFKDAYVCFSHFMDAVTHQIDLSRAYELLLRGAALSCQRNQVSVDFLAPVHFGSPDSTPLSKSSTSVMQAQVKNRNKPERVRVDPTLVQDTLPVLSIVHELGSSKTSVASSPFSSDEADLHLRHYKIVSHGCSSETFAVIPSSQNNLYPMILSSDKLMHDFPRSKIDECLALFRKMDPCSGLERAGKGRRGGNWSWFGEEVVQGQSQL